MKDKYIDHLGIDSLKHLKIAAERKADVFVTTNEEILEDREELEKVFGLKIRSLKEMCGDG